MKKPSCTPRRSLASPQQLQAHVGRKQGWGGEVHVAVAIVLGVTQLEAL